MLMKFINLEELKQKVKGKAFGICRWKAPIDKLIYLIEDLKEKILKI